MKALVTTLTALTLAGCANTKVDWPEEGKGGMAEGALEPLYSINPSQDFEPAHALRMDLDHSIRFLDILIVEGAQECFPATVLESREREHRIARELAGGLVDDAATNLVVHRRVLGQLERKLDHTRNRINCWEGLTLDRNPNDVAEELAQARALLNHDNQFVSAEDALNPKYKSNLSQAAFLIRRNPDWTLQVAGHTDDIDSEQNNELLGLQRAQRVIDYLLTQGIDLTRMSLMTQGELTPLAANDRSENRLVNRRVEIRVIPGTVLK